jgi:hypothetical protein
MTELLVIIPTRSRPEAVGRVVRAWNETGAFEDGAELLFVFDYDDPEFSAYSQACVYHGVPQHTIPSWRPLVPKLNGVAKLHAELAPHVPFLGFAGDDHLPRTRGWAKRYIDVLRAGTGIVYCDDGYQHENIPTQWAMTADIVRALGAMVPSGVEHLYCDNAVRDLGQTAECLTYLPDVLIEHMHPAAGKAPTDEQYDRVNGREQYRSDRAAYRMWRDRGGRIEDAERVRALIEGSKAT